MTADELRARLEADLRTAHVLRDADRPDGLTASSVGGCLSYAARALLGSPQNRTDDFWRALRGQYVHDGLGDDLAAVDPSFVDGRRQRFTWHPGGGLPDITGAFDFIIDGTAVELKTRSKAECRWHADHGPTDQECMQVAQAAEAEGCAQAAVWYLPTDAGWEESAVAMVDVAHWTREARAWLRMADVRDEHAALVARGVNPEDARRQVLDPVPRQKPYSWCTLFCRYLKDCRGDYVPPADLEIPDPTMRAAAQEADHWRAVRLDAEKREAAAKAMIRHVEGTVTPGSGDLLRVDQQQVAGKPGRRGHTRTVVTRRPE